MQHLWLGTLDGFLRKKNGRIHESFELFERWWFAGRNGNCLWEWEAKKGSNCWVFRGENNCIELVFKTDVSTKGVFQQVWNSHIVSPVVNPTAWVDFMVKSMVLKLKGLQKTSQVFQNHFVIPSGFGPPNLRVFFEPHHLSFQFRLVNGRLIIQDCGHDSKLRETGGPDSATGYFLQASGTTSKKRTLYTTGWRFGIKGG